MVTGTSNATPHSLSASQPNKRHRHLTVTVVLLSVLAVLLLSSPLSCVSLCLFFAVCHVHLTAYIRTFLSVFPSAWCITLKTHVRHASSRPPKPSPSSLDNLTPPSLPPSSPARQPILLHGSIVV